MEVGHSWGEGVGVTFSPPSLLLAAPVTSLAQSQPLLFCEHLITVQQQIEKRGVKPDLFSPSVFLNFAVPNVQNFTNMNLEVLLIKNLCRQFAFFFFLTVENRE